MTAAKVAASGEAHLQLSAIAGRIALRSESALGLTAEHRAECREAISACTLMVLSPLLCPASRRVTSECRDRNGLFSLRRFRRDNRPAWATGKNTVLARIRYSAPLFIDTPQGSGRAFRAYPTKQVLPKVISAHRPRVSGYLIRESTDGTAPLG